MFPIEHDTVDRILAEMGIANIETATIRQICTLADRLEKLAQDNMVHLEMGNPGLPASQIGIDAECAALRNGLPNKYPNIAGVAELKEAGSRFIKAFADVDIPGRCIVPTVGSMQGSFTMMMLLNRRIKGKDTMLFINPGFPAQHNQAKVLGLKEASFDLYDYRGSKLEAKLEEILSKGNITGILYSNPNNPAWTNFTEEELKIIGRLATQYDAIVLEDHAYFGMDFRTNYGIPWEPPYMPTVARYTDNYVMLLSASKIFSYAGQRIALVAMSEKVFDRTYDDLAKFFNIPGFGNAYIYGVLYCVSSGTAHSAQYALLAMLEAAIAGKLNFVEECRDYAVRAEKARKLFVDNGFHLVYDKDCDQSVSNGFFFTMGYDDMSGADLQRELLAYGIASISLPSTGSEQQGIRVCVSMLTEDGLFDQLGKRLENFAKSHKTNAT